MLLAIAPRQYGLINILDPKNNQTYIKGMKERYGTKNAVDNYRRK
jgi:hypothetical protein